MNKPILLKDTKGVLYVKESSGQIKRLHPKEVESKKERKETANKGCKEPGKNGKYYRSLSHRTTVVVAKTTVVPPRI